MEEVEAVPFKVTSNTSTSIPSIKVNVTVTSQCDLRPVSCRRDQILWIRPACSGWLVVLPHIHWCFCIKESYTRPGTIHTACTRLYRFDNEGRNICGDKIPVIARFP